MSILSFCKSMLPKLFVVIACCALFSKQSQASHAMGADFTYRCLGTNQYELTLTFYRDCSGVTAPTSATVDLTSINCGLAFTYTLPIDTIMEISSTCPSALSTCQGGTEPGVEEHIYIDTVTISTACSDYLFSFSECCRNTVDNLVSSSSEDLYIESFMDNTGGICNASPIFTSLGAPYLCQNQLYNYNFSAFDADGDSLTFALVNSKGDLGDTISFNPGYSVGYPILTTTGFVDFDTTNGQFSLTPSGLQVCAITVLIEEYRNDTIIGSVMRDIQVLVVNCGANNAPELTGINNVVNGTLVTPTSITLCVGDSLTFDLEFNDLDTADTLTLTHNLSTAFPTASLDTTGVNPLTASFGWMATSGDVGVNNLVVNIADDNCPISNIKGYLIEIHVLTATNAGPDRTMCLGDSVQMQGGGSGSFQWTPSTGLANDTVANTMASPSVTTKYYLTSGCGVVTDSMTINVVSTFTPTISGDQTICQGGSVQLSASATPSQNYTILWSPSAGLDSTQSWTPIASPNQTMTYTLTLTSPSLCVKTESVTVTVDSTVLLVTPSVSSKFLCPGDSTVLDANIIATDTLYTITWEDQNTIVVGNAEIITVYPTTDMTYTATITNGVCSDSKDVDVVVSILEIGTDSVTLCNGDSFPTNPVFGPIGSAPPTACGISTGCSGTGGISSYTVGTGTISNGTTTYPAPFGNWYKNAKQQLLFTAADLAAAGLTAGTITEIGFSIDSIVGTPIYYSYEIKLGCTSTGNLTVWETGLSQVFAPTDVTIAPGLNTLVLTNGFDWDGTTNLVMELCFDNLAEPSYTENSPTPFTTTSYTSALYYRSDATPACPIVGSETASNDRPNTTFTVCLEAFAPTFAWAPTAGVSDDTIVNPVITPSTSALYSLTMDNGLCVITDSVYVAYSSSFGLTGSTADASCGSTDGTATVTAGGGAAPLTYLWDDPSAQTNATATGLGVGSYTVNIIDANGCSDAMVLSVSEAGGPTLTATQVDLSCFGGSTGSATVTATGGTSPYTYLWDDPGTQTGVTATGLQAGTYQVNVTGAGCASSIAVTLTEPAQMMVTTSNGTPTCFGDCNGTANAAVTGGTTPFTYLWDDPSSQTSAAANGLCDGTFKVVYTDANGCVDSTNVTVTEPVAIVASITSMTQNPCFGDCLGSATVAVGSGGVAPFAYLWDDPSAQTNATATTLCAASYVGTVTDSNGCTGNTVAVITEPIGTSTVMTSVDASCGANDGSAIVAASGGVSPYTYSWNDPGSQTTATAGGVGFGIYTVVIVDANGCSTMDSVSVNNVGAPTLSAVVDSNVSCFGLSDGGATATATGGTPPILYVWDDPSTQTTATATGLGAGSYTVTAIDSNTCAASAFITITEPPLLTATIAVTHVTCNAACDGTGSTAVSGGTSPYQYLWNDGSAQTTANATSLCFGTRSCTITDLLGCTVVVSDSVGEPAKLFTSATSTDESCSAGNGMATIGLVGGTLPYTYLWDDPSTQTNPIATSLSAGTYVVQITDANGCTATDSVSISNTDVSLDNVTSVDANCGACDGSATAIVSGGATPYTYLWNDLSAQTDSTATGLCQGMYMVILTDANGCSKTGSVMVSEPAGFTASSTQQDLVCGGVCDGSATVATSGGTSPFAYSWDDPASQTTATATGLCAGAATATITDSAGCSVTETVTITGPNALSVTTTESPATTGNNDGSATASVMGGSNPLTYLWDDVAAQTTATATGLPAATYMVTVTDGAGCTATSTVTVSEGTGVWDLEIGARFDVYPNPTTGMVTFDLELLEVGGITIEVMDVAGKVVYTTAHTSVHLMKKEADLTSLSDGIYFVRLSTEKGTMKRRVVVTK